ncbi:hypothetical protein A9Q81_02550 [Gammaproteobacteria bacterium 42_54_T18]|nr:hypothetical protein A9Q81_02550 [Gammaproteobacteria bacterium 42_54_T18]
MKVLFHYDAGPALKKQLESLKSQGLDIVCCPEGPEQPFMDELKDAEVIWHVLHPLTRDIIEQAPKLKLIQKIGVGTNTIDLDAAKEKGIIVCNMPGTNSQATAEMTLLLMMAALRRLLIMDNTCRSGQWRITKETEEQLFEIKGKTIGLVGFGGIPKILAPILEAMGANIVYTATKEKSDVKYHYLSLDELLKQSDIVSLHAALTNATDKMINQRALSLMKDGAILVNAGRGALIDESAVYEALVSGKLGAAGFDVFTQEPVNEDNPLLALDNVVLSPHLGWLTRETLDRSVEVAAKNSVSIWDDTPLVFRVA